MQVFGLPGHVIRSDALARWRQAMRDGLSAEQAARAVAVPRTTLYRWENQLEPRSKRPHHLRKPTWTPALVEAVEHLRLDHPMWGRAKIGPLLRREGVVVSDATVGRIIAHLVARGVVEPVPTLRRRKGAAARTWRRKHATRLPKGRKATKPGELVQVDTLSVNVRPDRAIKHFTAYDPIARFTAAQAFSTAAPPASSTSSSPSCPSPSQASRSTAAPSSWPSSSRPAPTRTSHSSSSRHDAQTSTVPSNAPKAHGATSSMPATISRTGLSPSTSASTASLISTTTTDPTAHLVDEPQPSTFQPSAPGTRRLICAEPGHVLVPPCPICYPLPRSHGPVIANAVPVST